MTEFIPDWLEIASLSPPGGADADSVLQKTKEVKQRQRVPLNGAFLTTLGLVSNEVLKDVASSDESEGALIDKLREKLKPFQQISWEREAEIWNGNIVTGGKIRTQGPAVKGASQQMLELLKPAEQTSLAA